MAPPWPHCYLQFPHTAPRPPMAAARTTSLLPGVWAWLAAPAPANATHMAPTVAPVTQLRVSALAAQASGASSVTAVSLASGTSVALSLMAGAAAPPAAVTPGALCGMTASR